MWLLLLEALGALVLLLALVWWTMFAGRRRGERRSEGDGVGGGEDLGDGGDSRRPPGT